MDGDNKPKCDPVSDTCEDDKEKGEFVSNKNCKLSEQDGSGTSTDEDFDHISKQYTRRNNELGGLLLSLLDAAGDTQDEVRDSIRWAIFMLGRTRPYQVLLTVFNYLTNDRPKGFMQRICILQTVEDVCREAGSDPHCLSDHEVMEIAPLIVNEMVKSKEIIPQIQLPCSEALVGLGQMHCFQVMDTLTGKFETSKLPHFFVLQTMGALAGTNVYTMVPFIKGILGPMQPMLNTVKNDDLKCAFAFVMARFCECICEYLANIDKAPDPLVKKEFYSAEVNAAYDILFNQWLSSKNVKVRLQVCSAIGHMAHIMDTERLADCLARLLPALLALYRHQRPHASTGGAASGAASQGVEPYPVTCALTHVLDASLAAGRHVLELHLDVTLAALFQQVCAAPDYNVPSTVKNHYEVLRCCDILAKCSPEPVVGFFLSRLAHSSERVRAGSLSVLKHLINASEYELTQRMHDIQSALRLLLNDSSVKVKKWLTQVIVALAYRGYLTHQDAPVFVDFIVRQCCLVDEPTFSQSSSRRTSTAIDACDDSLSGESLRSMCTSVLYLLCTTVDCVLPLLWPRLLVYLTLDQCRPALTTLLKCCTQLAQRAQTAAAAAAVETDIFAAAERGDDAGGGGGRAELHGGVPSASTLLSLMCVWLWTPHQHERALQTIQLMGAMVGQLQPALQRLWDQQLPRLQQQLEESGGESGVNDKSRVEAWQRVVFQFVRESLDTVDNSEWIDQVGRLGRLSLLRPSCSVSVVPIRPLSVLAAPSTAAAVSVFTGGCGGGLLQSHPSCPPHGGSSSPSFSLEWSSQAALSDNVSPPFSSRDLASSVSRLLSPCSSSLSVSSTSPPSLSPLASSAEERAFLMRCLAVCTCRPLLPQQLVFAALDTIITATRHALPVERQGCAVALGIISSAHLDIVLTKLTDIAASELSKKPTGLLGLLKDTKGELAQERLRATVVLCYGQVARYTPRVQLVRRLDQPICQHLHKFITNCRSVDVRLAIVSSIGELAAALRVQDCASAGDANTDDTASRRGGGGGGGAVLEAGHQMLQFVLASVAHVAECEDKTGALLTVIDAVTALVGLEPMLPDEQRTQVLNTVLGAILRRQQQQQSHSLPPSSTSVLPNSQAPAADTQTHTDKVMKSVEALLRCLLSGDLSSATVDDIVACLLPWLASSADGERAASLLLLAFTLQEYLHKWCAGERSVAMNFALGGQLLAALVPRCVDAHPSVTQTALDAVQSVLSILSFCGGTPCDTAALSSIRSSLLEDNEPATSTHFTSLAQLLCERVPSCQLGRFFDTLLLSVSQEPVSGATAVATAVTMLLTLRGGEFYQRVPDLLHGLHGTLSETVHRDIRVQLLTAIVTLSHHHTASVCSALLLYPLPFDQHVVDCWQWLAGDELVASTVLSQLLDLLTSIAPYEQHGDGSRLHASPSSLSASRTLSSASSAATTQQPPPPGGATLRVANLQPLAAMCALSEIFSVTAISRQCRLQEASLYVRLLSAQAAYVGVCPPVASTTTAGGAATGGAASGGGGRQMPAHAFVPNRGAYKLSPYRIASDALLSFLQCVGASQLADSLAPLNSEPIEDMIRYSTYITDVTRETVTHGARMLSDMVPLMAANLSSMYEPQRVAAVAFYAQLLCARGAGCVSVAQTLVGSLLSCLVDCSPVVRRVCLLGLGHISCLCRAGVGDAEFSHVVESNCAAVMSAMLAGLDDAGDGLATVCVPDSASIPLQALKSLTLLLPVLGAGEAAGGLQHVHHTIIPITLRIRVYFENEAVSLRASSVALFGVCAGVCQRVGGPLLDQYLEQTHNNLVSLAVHLCDPQPSVAAACRQTLMQLSSLIAAPSVTAVLRKHLATDERLQGTSFFSQLSQGMVEELEVNLGMYLMCLLGQLKSHWSELKGAAALFISYIMSNLPEVHRHNMRVQPICCALKQLLSDSDWRVRVYAATAISKLHDY